MKSKYIKGLWLLYALGGALLILLPSYLPLNDIAEHAYLISLIQRYLAGEEFLINNYTLNFFQPYGFIHIPATLLSYTFGIKFALRLVLLFCFLLFVYSVKKISELFGGFQGLVFFAFPLFFGLAFWYGFLPFVFATSLMYFTIFQTLLYLENDKKKLLFFLSMYTSIIFLSHILAYGLTITMIFLLCLVSKKDIKRRLLPLIFLIPSFVMCVYWAIDSPIINHLVTSASNAQGISLSFVKIKNSFTYLYPSLFRIVENNSVPISWHYYFLTLLLLPPFFISKDLRRWIPFIVAILIFVFIPNKMGNADSVKYRFSQYVFIGLLFIFTAPKYNWYGKILWVKSISFSLVFYLFIASRVYGFHHESKSFNCLLEHNKSKSSYQITGNQHSHHIDGMAYSHFPAWLAAENDGYLPWSFAYYPHSPIVLIGKAVPEDIDITTIIRNPNLRALNLSACGEWKTKNSNRYLYAHVRK